VAKSAGSADPVRAEKLRGLPSVEELSQRLEGVPNVFASPVGAKGRVYLAGQEGTTLVIKHGPTYEVLAKNVLDDGFNASPALVDSELYLRGFKYLYSIGR